MSTFDKLADCYGADSLLYQVLSLIAALLCVVACVLLIFGVVLAPYYILKLGGYP